MTNREQRMDEFIKMVAYDYQLNPGIYRNSKPVYTFLTNYGLPKEEAGKYINFYFPRWIERFKNVPNIEVFNTQSWKYFCQFENMNGISPEACEQIKIYIPLDSNNIFDGANMLFDYLSKENIKHMSKIGSNVRMDDIVVRVFNKNDAKKVQNFVANNKFIKKGLIPANPFAITDGSIAFACDGSLSYNSEICDLIYEYMNILKEQNKLHEASLNDFKVFLDERLRAYSTREGFSLLATKHKNKNCVLSAYNVGRLINKSIKGGTVDDVLSHFESISVPEYRNAQLDNIEKTMNNDLSYKNNMLYIAINETCKKYSIHQAVAALQKYYNDGDSKSFTSSNGSRVSIEALTKEDIDYIYYRLFNNTIKDDGSLEKLAYKLANVQRENDEGYAVTQEPETEDILSNPLEIACYETYLKYGEKYTIGAIGQVISSGNYRGFTRDKNARNNLRSTMSPKDILQTIIQSLSHVETKDINVISATYFDYVKGKYALQR